MNLWFYKRTTKISLIVKKKNLQKIEYAKNNAPFRVFKTWHRVVFLLSPNPQIQTVYFLLEAKLNLETRWPIHLSVHQRNKLCQSPEKQSIGSDLSRRMKKTITMITKKSTRRQRNHIRSHRRRQFSRKIDTWCICRWCTSCFRTIINHRRSIVSLSLTL